MYIYRRLERYVLLEAAAGTASVAITKNRKETNVKKEEEEEEEEIYL